MKRLSLICLVFILVLVSACAPAMGVEEDAEAAETGVAVVSETATKAEGPVEAEVVEDEEPEDTQVSEAIAGSESKAEPLVLPAESESANTQVSEATAESESEAEPLVLPAESSERSDELALELLNLGSAIKAQEFVGLCEEAGFEVLLQEHFDKAKHDPAHNCAFTISEGNVIRGDETCPALLVTIRGTMGGEWYSNFDFCPSHSEDPAFAENFLFCAEDVFASLQDLLDAKEPGTAVIITGISRGAACANLLGLLVNEYLSGQEAQEAQDADAQVAQKTQDAQVAQGSPVDDVYVYTFACPNVIGKNGKNGKAQELPEQENIFNYINPADLIPMVPLSEWGFTRLGTDIILPQDDQVLIEASEQYAKTILDIAPTITDYYTERHSLTASGDDPFGLTPFELMMLLSTRIIEDSDKVIYEDGNLVWQGSYQAPSSLFDTFKDSDYAELINVLDPLFQGHNGKMLKLLMQHMPLTYTVLIQKMILQ